MKKKTLLVLPMLILFSGGCTSLRNILPGAGIFWTVPAPQKLYENCSLAFVKGSWKELEQASKDFIEYYPLHTKNSWVRYYLAMAYQNQKKSRQAKTLLIQITPEADSDTALKVKVYLALATIESKTVEGQPKAIRYYERLLSLDRTLYDAPRVLFALSKLYQKNREPIKAKKLLFELETKYPDSVFSAM